MSNIIQVIGVDPALRNFGFAHAKLDLDTMSFEVEKVSLVKTSAAKSKTTRKNSDDLDRCRAQYLGLKEAEKSARIAFVEMPVGSQSARAMMSYGACMALVAALDIPVIQLTPNEVKIAAVDDKNATKREMIDWAFNLFPNAGWLTSRGRLIDDNEHMADAIGAINAGLQNSEFQAIVAMMRRVAA
jgi:Holliday junction resolvasome RuvABC endonuclease subunit